jgi:hypothetical protein
MRFDRFSDDEPQPIAEVLEDGDHVCEITAEKEWTSQDGAREAVILTFTPLSGNHPFDKFFDPSEERDHKAAHQLLAAAGLEGDTDVGAGQLKGKRVTVTTKRATDKAGLPKVDTRTGLQKIWINGFASAAQPARPADEPQWKVNAIKKKPAAAKVAGGGSDDIPF